MRKKSTEMKIKEVLNLDALVITVYRNTCTTYDMYAIRKPNGDLSSNSNEIVEVVGDL